jgi:hypothetical protein
VHAARCVVAQGVPVERGVADWDGKSLGRTRMHGSGKLMRVLQAGCRGRSRDARPVGGGRAGSGTAGTPPPYRPPSPAPETALVPIFSLFYFLA